MGLLKITLITYLICVVYCTKQDITINDCSYIKHINGTEYYGNYGYTRPRVIFIKVTCSSVDLKNGGLPSDSTYQFDCGSCPTFLKITNSSIPKIPPSAFTEYTTVTVLDITSCAVEDIIPGAFTSLVALEGLYLSNNHITNISEGLFNSLLKLRVLDLSRNNIQNVNTHSFSGAVNLQILNLSHNALQHIDTSLAHVERLSELDLSFNHLTEFSFTLNADKVVNLNLSNNHIQNVFGCFAVLARLNLSNNELTTLANNTCPGGISKITTLDLNCNSLSVLKSIPSLRSLSYLSLGENNITVLSNEFFSKLNDLVFLNLSSNQMDQLQYGLLDGLSSLEVLDISKNHLMSFKKFNYHLMKRLRELYLHDNEISSFESKELTEVLRQLETISLDGNSFDCNTLIETFHDLRTVKVVSGHYFSGSNIHGIACSDVDYNSSNPSGQNFDANPSVTESFKTKLMRLFNSDFTKSFMYNYFNSGFKKSNFYKYLENLKFIENVTMNNYDNLRNIQKSQDDISKNMQGYFNNDFRKSNFVKYLDNLASKENSLNTTFAKSVMYNYFNKDFVNSNFYKYLEALRKPQFAIKYSDMGNETRMEKLVTTIAEEEEKNDNSALLVVIIVFLVIISCIMLCSKYAAFNKYGRIPNLRHEQVELMDT